MAVRKALLAAIDHYPNPANNLPSCLNDAKAFERTLRASYGFSDPNIRTLLDEQATLANVEAALDWLFAGAGPDDRLVFYFSGHGFQVRRGENLDEVLCVHDKFLFDDALSQRTQALPPGVFTLVSDSCHSGGMYKILVGFDGVDSIQVAQTKVLRVPPPAEEEKAFVSPADVRSLRYRPFGARAGSLAAIAKRFDMPLPKGFDEGGQTAMNGLLLSACLENETASASTPKTDGKSAFTFALLQQLDALGFNVSNRRLVEGVTASLRQLGFRQTPVMMEPQAPPGLGDRSFLSLAGTSPAGPDDKIMPMGPEFMRLIQQAVEATRRAATQTPAATAGR